MRRPLAVKGDRSDFLPVVTGAVVEDVGEVATPYRRLPFALVEALVVERGA
jgi:hypothetical protein